VLQAARAIAGRWTSTWSPHGKAAAEKLLVADIDTTIIKCRMPDELADRAGAETPNRLPSPNVHAAANEFEAALR
jgi:hypothetical protein